MSRGRVVFVTRRFWPLVGDAESALADLAVGLNGRGFSPTVVTPRWRSDWPELFMFDGVPVVRLAKPSKSWWGQAAFARSVATWLRTNSQSVDLVVSVGGEDLDSMAVAASRLRIPILLLADEARTSWQEPRRLFQKTDRRASIAIIQHESEREHLLAVEYGESAIRVIAPGVQIRPPRDRHTLRAARAAIARAIGDVKVSPHAPLAVGFQSLDDVVGITPLITSWKQVASRHLDARLWIFGAGRNRAELMNHAEQLGLGQRVRFPGVMESTDELFEGIDFLIALESSGCSRTMLEAMAAGVTVVAADTPEHRRYITNLENGVLSDADEPESWAQAISRLLEQPALAAALGSSARLRVERDFPLARRLDRFAELFDEFIPGDKRP